MAISFDAALGVQPQALSLRSQRTEVLANNIANSDTPKFQARDIPFKAMLDDAMTLTQTDAAASAMAQTRTGHLEGKPSALEESLLYRVPLMPAIDGNTVDIHTEQAAFAENSFQFQAAMQFLNGRFKGLMTAIKGE